MNDKYAYVVCDYSNCKKGDNFNAKQIKYIDKFVSKTQAIKYAKQLKRKNIGIEVWTIDEEGHMNEFVNSFEI